MSAFKYFTMMECPRRRVLQQTTEQKPDCSVAVKESESEDDLSWMHWQHARQLCEPMVRVWRLRDKAGYEWSWPMTVRQLDVRWLQVCAWHDRSYTTGIPLLAHSLTVKLSPCPNSHSSPAGRIAACLWAFQMQFATHSGSPQDDSASSKYITSTYIYTSEDQAPLNAWHFGINCTSVRH